MNYMQMLYLLNYASVNVREVKNEKMQKNKMHNMQKNNIHISVTNNIGHEHLGHSKYHVYHRRYPHIATDHIGHKGETSNVSPVVYIPLSCS